MKAAECHHKPELSKVRGREVECRPRNLEVPSSIPGSGCQLWDFFIGPHIRREYWCSSQEAESREISISCKNLFLNRCKINMFKLNTITNLSHSPHHKLPLSSLFLCHHHHHHLKMNQILPIPKQNTKSCYKHL